MKKIAFCFLIYDKIDHEELWYKYLKNIDINKYSIYIHYKTNTPLKYFDNFKLDYCCKTKWGTHSLIHAHNLLFKKALDDGNYKIISLSQSCVPLKSFDYIYNFCTNDDFCHLNTTVNQRGAHRAYSLTNYNIDKKFIHKSANWFILNRKITKIVTDISNDIIDKLYSSIKSAEEHYYITTIYLNNLQNECKLYPNLALGPTFANWHDMKYKFNNPLTHRNLKNYKKISEEELNYLCKSNPLPLFGRKFLQNCMVTPNNIPLTDFLLKKISNIKKYLTTAQLRVPGSPRAVPDAEPRRVEIHLLNRCYSISLYLTNNFYNLLLMMTIYSMTGNYLV